MLKGKCDRENVIGKDYDRENMVKTVVDKVIETVIGRL